MAGVIRKKNPGDAWETVLDTGGGGSQPVTDEVLEFAETALSGPTVAITDVDVGLTWVKVAGDQTQYVPFAAEVAAGPDTLYVVIEDNIDANGLRGLADATYDAESDKTTITFDGPLPDDPTGANVRFLALTRYDIVLPAEGSIEWVYVEVTEAFAGGGGNESYFWVGDGDGINTFIPIRGPSEEFPYILADVGIFEWPMLTLNPTATAVEHAAAAGLKRYPGGGAVHAIFQQVTPGVSGRMTVTVHHHFGELATPTVAPS